MSDAGRVYKAKEIGKPGWGKYILLPCKLCGTKRWVRILKGKPDKDYCVKCANILVQQSKRVVIKCSYCGKIFDRQRHEYKENRENFCSLECVNKYQKENPYYFGENHPRWGGGYNQKFYDAATHANERARKHGVDGEITPDDVREVLTEKAVCAYCGASDDLEIDHVIPMSKGGLNIRSNIVPCCDSCNSKKTNKIIRLL